MKNLLIIALFSTLLFSAEVIAKGKGDGNGKKLNKGQVNSTIKKATNPGNPKLLNKGKVKKLDKSISKDTKDMINELTR